MDVDASGMGSLHGHTLQVVVEAIGLLCCLDFLDAAAGALGGHEDDQTLGGSSTWW